jgi:hypothetical protein
MTRQISPNEKAAHLYADAGWPVFPLIPGEKVPVTRHGFQDATTRHHQIESWWWSNPGRNVGIRTGQPGPDVLDIDRHADGTGYPAFNELKREGLVPEARAAVRTPSGGLHLYFAGTGQRNGHLARHHIDFRSQGGYVVAPPSTAGRKPYIVVQHQAAAATFDWEAARRYLEPEGEQQRHQCREPPGVHLVNPDRLARWVAGQREGNRNAGLFYAANRALDAGREDILPALARAAREAGLEDREIDRTIRSAQEGQQRDVRPRDVHPKGQQREAGRGQLDREMEIV